ncbi:MAG TPA: hypothetical protein VN030_01865 [Cellvibrio sp.]|nr:hypothetical protein [Cellvibrio sp.]
MKKNVSIGLFLFLFSQFSWAGLIELQGYAIGQKLGSSDPTSVSMITSLIVDTDVADTNADPRGGFFVNAIKSGSAILSNGRQYNLNVSAPNATNIETKVFDNGGNTFEFGLLSLRVSFIDILGEIISLTFSSHNLPFAGVGFVGAGHTLAGLENVVQFEGAGEMCRFCNTKDISVMNLTTEFFSTGALISVPEPQGLLFLGLGLLVSVRWLKRNKLGRM